MIEQWGSLIWLHVHVKKKPVLCVDARLAGIKLYHGRIYRLVFYARFWFGSEQTKPSQSSMMVYTRILLIKAHLEPILSPDFWHL